MLKKLRTPPSTALILTSKAIPKIKFPEKFKGTIVEKWADYWKNLFIDYRQMLQDLRQDIQDEPRKAFMWSLALGTLYSLARNNPNERDFKDDLRRLSNEMVMLSEACHNPKAIDHLRFLQVCNNEGVMQYKSLGIISFMYISDINNTCDLYKARCAYLQPTNFSLLSRLVDVGFMGRWWNIYIKTINYDVNV